MKYAWLLILMLVLAACQETKEFPEIPVQETDSADEADELDQVAEETDESIEEVMPDISAKEEFEAFMQIEPEFKAEYKATTTIEGQAVTIDQVIAVRGKDMMQSTSEDAMYVIDDKVYVCANFDAWECYEMPQQEEVEEADFKVPDGVIVERISDKRVAGITAKCFKLIEEAAYAVQCVNDKGVMLYFLSEATNYSIETKATSITGISASDFDLPAEPQPFDPETYYQNLIEIE
ncbi:hypothetical protein ACFL1B_03065 [Nanoarchaeota archaeon]